MASNLDRSRRYFRKVNMNKLPRITREPNPPQLSFALGRSTEDNAIVLVMQLTHPDVPGSQIPIAVMDYEEIGELITMLSECRERLKI